jgi:hypothetical protein
MEAVVLDRYMYLVIIISYPAFLGMTNSPQMMDPDRLRQT